MHMPMEHMLTLPGVALTMWCWGGNAHIWHGFDTLDVMMHNWVTHHAALAQSQEWAPLSHGLSDAGTAVVGDQG